jgi:cytidine deaminase
MNPLRLVARLTAKSNHKVFRHCAIIIRGGAIVSSASNHNTTHAEVAALNRLWPSERRGTKVWSIRLTRGGKLGMAKPCPNCLRYLRESGVKVVYYSDSRGDIQMEKI